MVAIVNWPNLLDINTTLVFEVCHKYNNFTKHWIYIIPAFGPTYHFRILTSLIFTSQQLTQNSLSFKGWHSVTQHETFTAFVGGRSKLGWLVKICYYSLNSFMQYVRLCNNYNTFFTTFLKLTPNYTPRSHLVGYAQLNVKRYLKT